MYPLLADAAVDVSGVPLHGRTKVVPGYSLAPLQGHPARDLQFRLKITWQQSESSENAGKRRCIVMAFGER